MRHSPALAGSSLAASIAPGGGSAAKMNRNLFGAQSRLALNAGLGKIFSHKRQPGAGCAMLGR
jgi:hypothetical protein